MLIDLDLIRWINLINNYVQTTSEKNNQEF